MRSQLMGLLCVVVSGCTFGLNPCETTADCPGGATCSAEKFCVAGSSNTGGGGDVSGGGTGTGGGTASGGGGSTTGGGTNTGGGNTGGGSGVICDGGCADWQICSAAASCEDVSVAWVTPTAGTTFGPSRSINYQLSVTLADGGPASVQVPFSSGTVSLTLSTPYLGSINSNTNEGLQTLKAGWPDAGPYAEVAIAVDATPPVALLDVPAGVFQRDSSIYGLLHANEALSDAGVVFDGIQAQRVSDSLCNNSSAYQFISCFRLDLSAPPLNALDGGFKTYVSATDVYGNSTVDGGPPVGVTRLRWATNPTAQQIQALSVGSEGSLYVGTSGTGSNTIIKLSAAGSVIADAGALGEVQSLAIDNNGAQDTVYVAYNTLSIPTVGYIGARDENLQLPVGLRSACSGANGSKTYSGLALYLPANSLPGAVAQAVGSINSTGTNDGRGCIYKTDNAYDTIANNSKTLDSAVVSATGAVTTANNVVIHGDTASFIHQDTTVTVGGSFWQPVQLSGGPLVGSASRLSLDVTGTGGLGQSFGQASGDGRFLVTMAYDGTTNAQVYWMADGGSGNLTVNVSRGMAAIESSNRAYFGQGSDFVSFNPQTLDAGVHLIASLGTGESVRTSPVLGDTEGYAVSNKGTLIAFASDGGVPFEKWRVALAPGDAVLTHMAFDTNRANCDSNTGVLYVGTQSGAVYAVIVDSSHLYEGVGGSAWPKYQRTMGNAGNTDSLRFPINWPGCP